MNTPAGSFQITLNKLIKLSKTELKKFVVYAILSLISTLSALVSVAIALVLAAQLIPNSSQSYKLFLITAGFLSLTLIFSRMMRLSVMRLQTVIEPPASTFSLETSDSTDQAKAEITSNKSDSMTEVSNHRLPRTASKFYGMIGSRKDSMLEMLDSVFKPLKEIQSFTKTMPVLSVLTSFSAGLFISYLTTSKKESNVSATNLQSSSNNLVPPVKSNGSLISSTITELTLMALTYGAQTLIKELMSDKSTSKVPKKQNTDRATYAGQIIPFDSRQKVR